MTLRAKVKWVKVDAKFTVYGEMLGYWKGPDRMQVLHRATHNDAWYIEDPDGMDILTDAPDFAAPCPDRP